MLHPVTTLAFILHVSGGTIALFSGTAAIFARKGGRLHRTAGNIFVAAMLVMATFAVYLSLAMPDELPDFIIGLFSAYLVATAWMTVRRKAGEIGWFEKGALAVAILLSAPFAILSFQLATGMTPLIRSAVPFEGPVLVAIYSFTTVIVIAAIADAKVALAGGIEGTPRIARHLWRMCLGLTLATGSAFTNGLPRLLPGPMHVPPAFFFPQFIPVILLIFWMFRVRVLGWKIGVTSAA